MKEQEEEEEEGKKRTLKTRKLLAMVVGGEIGINGGTTTIRDGPIGKERRDSIRFRLAPSCGNETHRPLSPLSSLFDLRDRPPRPQLL